ncbi:hypothetical protein ACET3Z_030311 [Daucus carota]
MDSSSLRTLLGASIMAISGLYIRKCCGRLNPVEDSVDFELDVNIASSDQINGVNIASSDQSNGVIIQQCCAGLDPVEDSVSDQINGAITEKSCAGLDPVEDSVDFKLDMDIAYSNQNNDFIFYSRGLENYIYPKLYPYYPKQSETLSLAFGFAQSPTLKKILAHYAGDVIPTALDIVSESLRPDYKVRLKLKGVYSRITSSIVAVSSFFGVERKVDCSGFIVDWSSRNNEGTILTSAKVLCNPASSDHEFHLIVRMCDGTLLLAKEEYADFYNNILIVKVKSQVELKALDLTNSTDAGWERSADAVKNVAVVGRSFFSYAFQDSVGELDGEYGSFGCHKLLRTSCYAPQICEGGPLITYDGHVMGISFFGYGNYAHLLPTNAILSCLERWMFLSTPMRPYLGFTVLDIEKAPFQLCERLNLLHGEAHVLVHEVFEGSVAHKNNVRSLDRVVSVNGIPIHSADQYSRLLSEAVIDCADHSQPFMVCINTFGCTTEVSFMAEYLAVDDTRFYDCWPQVDGREWCREKFGSQENPRFCWPPRLEEDAC